MTPAPQPEHCGDCEHAKCRQEKVTVFCSETAYGGLACSHTLTDPCQFKPSRFKSHPHTPAPERKIKKGEDYLAGMISERSPSGVTNNMTFDIKKDCDGCEAEVAKHGRERVLPFLEELISPSVSDARKREIVDTLREQGEKGVSER